MKTKYQSPVADIQLNDETLEPFWLKPTKFMAILKYPYSSLLI